MVRLDYLPGNWKSRKTEHYVPGHVISADGPLSWLDERGKAQSSGFSCYRGQLRREDGAGETLAEVTFEPSNNSLTLVAFLGDTIIATTATGFALKVEENPPCLVINDLLDDAEVACAILGTWDATSQKASGAELVICDSSHAAVVSRIPLETAPRERLSPLAERM